MYMHHYFGVEFIAPVNPNHCEIHELVEETAMYLREDCDKCIDNWKKQLDELGKFFVAPESENIFQKTTRDVCGKVGNSCQIILRDDKQFFEAEVENER
jgi:hypothetical protein